MVAMRYGLNEDGEIHTLKQVATEFKITDSHVWQLLDRIRVRVDRETLLRDGVAMQLKTDLPLRDNVRPSNRCTPLSPAEMLDRLAAVGVDTYNDLLDKSLRWMFGGGIGRGTIVRVNEAINNQSMFLRGSVPGDFRLRTRLAHTLTQHP